MTGENPELVDVALDAIAEISARSRDDSPVQAALAALTCASLWRVVFDHARRRGDDELAGIASRERAHAAARYRELTAERVLDSHVT